MAADARWLLGRPLGCHTEAETDRYANIWKSRSRWAVPGQFPRRKDSTVSEIDQSNGAGCALHARLCSCDSTFGAVMHGDGCTAFSIGLELSGSPSAGWITLSASDLLVVRTGGASLPGSR